MKSFPELDVAIIGCGVSGLCLALTLQSHNIPCVVYEKRQEGFSQGGSITLFPNSLRILDRLGVYSTIHTQGFDMTTTTVKDASFKTLKTLQLSDVERYGYAALRIRRDDLIGTLTKKALELGIGIYFEHKLVNILDDGTDGVTFQFSNGDKKSAALLVGADGIWSQIRKLAIPNTPAPTYTGQAGMSWSVPRSELIYPAVAGELLSEAGAVTMSTPQGVVLFVPDSSDGVDMRIGAQRPLTERDAKGWKSLASDKAALTAILRDGASEAPEPVKSAIEWACKEDTDVFLWPFNIMGTLGEWVSKNGEGRIVLIGDAAHAFPPTGGQGAGMAVEDAEGLGLVLGTYREEISLRRALDLWQRWRKKRVDQAAEYTAQLGKSRVAPPPPSANDDSPEPKPKPANPLGDINDLAWLYDWKSKEQLTFWTKQEN